jgi:hypothetical protein
MTNSKKLTSMALIGFFLLAVSVVALDARVKINMSELSFESTGTESTESIGNYIIVGAGYFLNSYSDTLLFLNRVEMSDLDGADYNELQLILYRSMENMNNARKTYSRLREIAGRTPYKQDIVKRLMTFKYAGLQKEKNLNRPIFDEVKSYLKNGDTRGIYARALAATEQILQLQQTVNAAIDSGRLPEITDLWRLNQLYSDALLFGQYVSEVFLRIKTDAGI